MDEWDSDECPDCPPVPTYRHVGRFAPHGHDGCGWLGNTDVFVRAEDYDNHVNCTADQFAIYADNARLRGLLDKALRLLSVPISEADAAYGAECDYFLQHALATDFGGDDAARRAEA